MSLPYFFQFAIVFELKKEKKIKQKWKALNEKIVE